MEYVSVGILALFEFWFAYPAAQALQMDWVRASLLIAVSSSLGALIAILIAASFRDWFGKKLKTDGFIKKRTGRFMNKYGTIGLGLMAPWILGPVLTSLGAIVLGAEARQLSRWTIAGIWLWAIVVYGLIRVTGGLSWLFPH